MTRPALVLIGDYSIVQCFDISKCWARNLARASLMEVNSLEDVVKVRLTGIETPSFTDWTVYFSLSKGFIHQGHQTKLTRLRLLYKSFRDHKKVGSLLMLFSNTKIEMFVSLGL